MYALQVLETQASYRHSATQDKPTAQRTCSCFTNPCRLTRGMTPRTTATAAPTMCRIWCSMKLSPHTSSRRQGTPPAAAAAAVTLQSSSWVSLRVEVEVSSAYIAAAQVTTSLLTLQLTALYAPPTVKQPPAGRASALAELPAAAALTWHQWARKALASAGCTRCQR